MHMTITFTILFPRLEGRKHGWLWCTDVGDEDYVRAVMGSSASTFSPWEVRAEKDETGRHTDKIIEGDNFLGEFQPSLEHASLGGVISGVRLSGVTIEDLLSVPLAQYDTKSYKYCSRTGSVLPQQYVE